MRGVLNRVAGAPITWGVCEVPGWGHQLSPERVLAEMAEIGLRATEMGPEGYLPGDRERLGELLGAHGLSVVAGFLPIVLHRAAGVTEQLDRAARFGDLLKNAGADVMVLGAVTGANGYEGSGDLDNTTWITLTETLDRVIDIGAERDLRVALHPHYGTMIESSQAITRLVGSSPVDLCIDTGHLTIGGADPLEILDAAGERVAHVHLKDVDRRLAEQVRAGSIAYHDAVVNGLYRPLGKGDVPIVAVVETLERSGYSGWYVLEQDAVLEDFPVAPGGPITDARASLEFLKKVTQTSEVVEMGRAGSSDNVSPG